MTLGMGAYMSRYTFLITFFSMIFSFQSVASNGATENLQTATFAAGCFWCAQQAFDGVPGVKRTVVGYSGGKSSTATYNQVSSGATDHIESIQVIFDADVISYEKLLLSFWKNVDPTVSNRQFCDKGYQYSSAIFVHDETQRDIAMKSKQKIYDLLGVNHTLILSYDAFYNAEIYHQKYYKKNPIRYKYYKYSCGREKRLDNIWGKIKFDNYVFGEESSGP